ncbi:MAG TPA: NAD(P)/FAD-dependent oxidoreductase [Myxococcota bacterium]|nr:NAD(P)/FAD-dependent oxidoreductase [Myxococcota bacterium]
MRPAPKDAPFSIAILGAGFAGLGTAIQLKRAGIRDFTIFERAGEVGGTWRDNTYPGAACDVPSHVYSLSFEPNPDWSRAFAESGEIHRYLLRLVEKWGLRPHLRLDTEIVEARWDESSGRWELTTNRDERVEARVVVSGVGGLVDPRWPDLKGLESFAGEVMHTARWDHDYDLAGKRVGVVGTGASAVQVVPSIAPQVESLAVFQRTAAWVMPKQDRVYSERVRRFLARHPAALRASRLAQYWLSEIMGPMIYLDAPRLSAVAERGSLRYLEQAVRDPDVRARLTPSFQFGCKRILISDDYWQAFDRPNVELVTDPIDELVREGVRTKDGRVRELDALVLATGFALNIATAPFPVIGRGGRSLADVWKDGASAYKGLSVHGFPNWFILMGPNTGPGHTSVLVFTEAQISHALGAIRRMRERGWKSVEVRRDAQEGYNAGLERRMRHMVWSSGCKSWYLSPDGKNHSLYPGPAAEYALRARRFRASDYAIERW